MSSAEETCSPADLPVDVAKALGPENLNLRAVAALSHDAALPRGGNWCGVSFFGCNGVGSSDGANVW